MTVTLRNSTETGQLLQATYLPEKGLNLISFKIDDLELIDQSTKKAFEERFGGLGPMIGPHFHRRNPATIPPIKDESLFPFIAFATAHGSADPFSHGIGRYAPWKVESTETTCKGILTGKMCGKEFL